MAVMNLPREERFKRHNVILIGVIPAFKHEPKHLNYFLEPLVKELKPLWRGVEIDEIKGESANYTKIYGALLCCASDIPAARKLCGFMGHSAMKGCSHCLKSFPGGFKEKKDYSGFNDRNSWPKRSSRLHRFSVARILRSKTKKQKKELERTLGVRYTKLLDLPYYSSVIMCTIDPMHNLFLGTAKHLFKTWIEQGIISQADLQAIQEKMEKVTPISGTGQLPSNIASNYGGFTAAQWMNFILYYSLFVMKDALPDEHMQCLQKFVLACRFLCKRSVTEAEVFMADQKLLQFAKQFEALYGKKSVTINIHMHLHLLDCVMNHGGVYGFWLFSFERFNGILGQFKNNKKNGMEIQLMRKFLMGGSLFDKKFTMPEKFKNSFMKSCLDMHDDCDDGNEILYNNVRNLSICNGPLVADSPEWSDMSLCKLPGTHKLGIFDKDDISLLHSTYSTIYSADIMNKIPSINQSFLKFSSIEINGVSFNCSKKQPEENKGYIMASWCGDNGIATNSELRPGRVQYFFSHSVKIDGVYVSHCFALAEWFKKFQVETGYRRRLSVCLQKKLETPGSASFIPVQRIHSRCTSATDSYNGQDILIVSPENKSQFV